MGSRSFIDPSVTGSTGSTGQATSVAGAQTMPAPLTSPINAKGPYVPPADVGTSNIVPAYTASVTPSAASATTTAVVAQPLPPVISSGSQTTMPAQSAVQLAATPVPAQPAAPQVSAASAKPETPTGPVHVIASGESLYVIARKYGVEPNVIVKANNIASMDKIYIGQKLIIPGGKVTAAPVQTASIPAKQPPKAPVVSTPQPETVASTDAAETVTAMVKPAGANGKFRWPVSGTVITNFAESRSGINIAATEGTAVRAVDTGVVIYTGSAVQGYGNLILIKHDNGYVSAYAHLKDITVAKGETVGVGDAIGSMGMTGGVSRPQLHFELRKGATPVDPMPLLAG